MDDEQITENSEPAAESSAETTEAQVTESGSETTETQVADPIDYTDHLILIEQGQEVQSGLMCIMIGLILISVIFNVLKRFF